MRQNWVTTFLLLDLFNNKKQLVLIPTHEAAALLGIASNMLHEHAT